MLRSVPAFQEQGRRNRERIEAEQELQEAAAVQAADPPAPPQPSGRHSPVMSSATRSTKHSDLHPERVPRSQSGVAARKKVSRATARLVRVPASAFALEVAPQPKKKKKKKKKKNKDQPQPVPAEFPLFAPIPKRSAASMVRRFRAEVAHSVHNPQPSPYGHATAAPLYGSPIVWEPGSPYSHHTLPTQQGSQGTVGLGSPSHTAPSTSMHALSPLGAPNATVLYSIHSRKADRVKEEILVSDWEIQQVIDWITSIPVRRDYSHIVESQHIPGIVLLTMRSQDWRALGVEDEIDVRILAEQVDMLRPTGIQWTEEQASSRPGSSLSDLSPTKDQGTQIELEMTGVVGGGSGGLLKLKNRDKRAEEQKVRIVKPGEEEPKEPGAGGGHPAVSLSDLEAMMGVQRQLSAEPDGDSGRISSAAALAAAQHSLAAAPPTSQDAAGTDPSPQPPPQPPPPPASTPPRQSPEPHEIPLPESGPDSGSGSGPPTPTAGSSSREGGEGGAVSAAHQAPSTPQPLSETPSESGGTARRPPAPAGTTQATRRRRQAARRRREGRHRRERAIQALKPAQLSEEDDPSPSEQPPPASAPATALSRQRRYRTKVVAPTEERTFVGRRNVKPSPLEEPEGPEFESAPATATEQDPIEVARVRVVADPVLFALPPVPLAPPAPPSGGIASSRTPPAPPAELEDSSPSDANADAEPVLRGRAVPAAPPALSESDGEAMEQPQKVPVESPESQSAEPPEEEKSAARISQATRRRRNRNRPIIDVW